MGLPKLKVKRKLLGRVKSLKLLGYYRHTTQKFKSVEKEIVYGGTPGNRSCDRQRRCWTDDIMEWTVANDQRNSK